MSVDYRALAYQKAQQYGISNPQWFVKQIGAESNFNPSAVSPAGAIGIAQIMPGTARGWGVDPRDPVAALDAAARNMALYERKYGGYRNALVAYNAGPGRVGKPLYAETANYIQKIMGGADSPAPGGAAPFVPQASGIGAPTPAGVQLDADTVRRIADWNQRSEAGVMNGQTVEMDADLVAKIKAARAAAGSSMIGAPSPAFTGGATPAASTGVSLPEGAAFSPGGNGGDWGGSAPLAEQIAEAAGLPVTSRKRDRQLTASGNPSDHWVGMPDSYAVDLGTSGAAGDAALAKLMARLGRPDYKGGSWLNFNMGNYRIQVGWRVPGHYDHIHAGVRRIS